MNGINTTTKGIFLDLDDTLYSYEYCNEYAKDQLFEHLQSKLKIEKIKISEAFSQARKRVHHDLANTGSSHSRLLYIQKMLEELSSHTEFKETLICHEIFWSGFFQKMKLFPQVKEFLIAAKNKNLKIAIVTDLTTEIQIKKILHLNLEAEIDFLISSEEAGFEKPHEAMFKLALEKSKLEAKQVIMIGDSLTKDIEGAEKMGISAIHFKKEENFFRNLKEAISSI